MTAPIKNMFGANKNADKEMKMQNMMQTMDGLEAGMRKLAAKAGVSAEALKMPDEVSDEPEPGGKKEGKGKEGKDEKKKKPKDEEDEDSLISKPKDEKKKKKKKEEEEEEEASLLVKPKDEKKKKKKEE